MKCVNCDHDSKYPERSGRKCPQCLHLFAFEPREGDPFTDVAFKRAIEAVSAAGQVRWGVEHLYYELCRRKRISPNAPKALGCLAGIIAVLSVILALAVKPLWLLGLGVALILAAVSLGVKSASRHVRLEYATFSRLYDRWVAVHSVPAGVITRKPQPSQVREVESDLADYSFDRAVICDRARTVDLLVANNFHFENNCAILSIEGYPPGPFKTVLKMLKRNPRLAVYALHDATPAGCRLAHRVATEPEWFAKKVKVIDVGLRPIHGKRFPGLLVPSKTSRVPAQEGISAWEAAWLSENALELAAIRPEQVLKRLFKTINTPIDPTQYADVDVIYLPPREEARSTSGGDGGNGGGDVAFASDAGDHDGPADSFG